MKILQTPVRFYPATGGVEQYALDLTKKLVELDNQVTVICANEPMSDIKELEDIKIKRINYCCKIANTNLALSLPFQLQKEEFDVLHTYLPTPWFADWSVFIAKLKKRKVLISYCNDITGNGIGNIIAKIYNNTFLKLTLRLVDKIIIIGPNYLDSSKYLKKYSSKVQFVPIGIDREKFKKMDIKKQKNTIFFLSVLDEFHKYKGLDSLLEAMKLVKKEIPDVKLIVGGTGNLLDYYKSKTQQLDIQDNVEFHGFIPDKELVEYYNKYEIFVLPSINSAQEGFGIVLLEALACGTPVITTNIVGMASEIKKYNAGKIVPIEDAQQLSKNIVSILNNQELKQQLKNNTLDLIRKFDLNVLTKKMLKIYKNL